MKHAWWAPWNSLGRGTEAHVITPTALSPPSPYAAGSSGVIRERNWTPPPPPPQARDTKCGHLMTLNQPPPLDRHAKEGRRRERKRDHLGHLPAKFELEQDMRVFKVKETKEGL